MSRRHLLYIIDQCTAELMNEWFTIRELLWEHYKCRRCKRPVECTKVPVQVTPRDITRIAEHTHMSVRDFMDVVLIWGKFIRPPCPFYVDDLGDGSPGCLIHGVRPLVCRPFPLGELPSIMALDYCPVARDMYRDLKAVEEKVSRGELEAAKSGVEEIMAEAWRKLYGDRKPDKKKAIEEFSRKKEKQLPEHSGEVMRVYYAPLPLFRLLLQEKQLG